MPADDLRPAVRDLMPRARSDLAELVAFRSVADPRQYPPKECENAATWVAEAFAAEGLEDVAASPTPDGSKCVHGHAEANGGPTVLLYCHYDVQSPLGEDAWRSPVAEGQGGSIPLVHHRAADRAGYGEYFIHRVTHTSTGG